MIGRSAGAVSCPRQSPLPGVVLDSSGAPAWCACDQCQGGDVTEPNEFDEFRRHQERQEGRRQILVRVLDVVTVLALAAIVVVVLNMFFY